MKMPRLNIKLIESDCCKEVNNMIKNDLFVCQMLDNTFVFAEKTGMDSLDCIMVNPQNYKIKGFTSWKINISNFSEFNNEALLPFKHKYFIVDKQSYSMREVYESLMDALICMRTGNNYNGYRVRKLD